ncbi:Eco57I restriction-modification methylase domain-containing protein [Natrarchaeobius oligotrophus]|uniref:site-specific DNA-methyltransferase (adenine-specific) n=1 Tax=Natrarchaeobius chitinivorans TaxID=1679083 RepID=A0A3N6MJ30_NATCH|nr:TaqI-like C-terminal specificity domain-containing protein [Natrarchaeobius chitinivorans]RQH03328.1 restriction endonuclease [Natrarchaeobius chitinivorans]
MSSVPDCCRNRGLFSDAVLERRLPETVAWNAADERDLRDAYESVAAVWERERTDAPNRTASELSASLVEPVGRALGFEFDRLESDPPSDRPRSRPPYAIVGTESDSGRPLADGPGDDPSTADEVRADDPRTAGRDDRPDLVVADVRRWGRSLEAQDSTGERGFENPSTRMAEFLRESPARWGVLTDGKRWRLYGDRPGRRFDAHLEIDLEEILETGDSTGFRYFYCLFGRVAFRNSSGPPLLEVAADERSVADRAVVDDLRRRCCRAVCVLARDDLERRGNVEAVGTDPAAADLESGDPLDDAGGGSGRRADGPLERTYDRALRACYRLVVDLYARGVRCGSVESGDGPSAPEPVDRDPLSRVDDDALDWAVAVLTDGSDADEPGFRDYSSLETRHLGTVYERLLEYRIEFADESRALGDDEYPIARAAIERSADDGTDRRVDAGGAYLTPASTDRKRTGSYYTPDPVVAYVVEHTLDPEIEEIRRELDRSPGEPGYVDAFAEELLELRVLDPAAGCGYFLERAVDRLTRALVVARERHAARGGLESLADGSLGRVRRRVTARCVYGVDLDPVAVDLARTSMWLRAGGDETVASALERHVKAGNALVGADRELLERLEVSVREKSPGDSNGGRQFDRSHDTDDARDRLRERLEAIADVQTTRAFAERAETSGGRAGTGVPADAIDRLSDALTDDDRWRRLAETEWFETARRRAESDRYFHWPLAFPDASDSAVPDAPPEFDAVVGNPPWVATAGRANVSAAMDSALRSYLEATFEATEGQFDLYVAFYERAIRLARDGRVGIVVPDSILAREQAGPIRRFVLEHAPPSRIARVGAAFDGVEAGVAILIGGGRESGEVACVDATDATDLRSLRTTGVPVGVFERQPAHRFLIHLDETTRDVLDRIDDHPPLSAVADLARGEEVSKRAAFLRDEPAADRRPIAPGSAIRRYDVDESELRYVDPAAIEKDERRYRSPKLAFRQTSDSLIGTYDPDGLATIKSVYTVRLESGSIDAYKHVLGALSSPLLNYYHHYKHAAYRSVFPQINQSTFESFPIAMDGGPDDELVAAVDERLAGTAERNAIPETIGPYLDEYDDGPTLGDLSSRVADPNERRGPSLTVTTDAWPNLRIGSVDVGRDGSTVVVSARLRYKPGRDRDTDRWGYAETDPIPALAIADADDDLATLLEAFVPYAVERADGFANYRAAATRTIAPIDRLRAIALPRLEDVAADLEAYVDDRERAANLDDRLAVVDRTIHDRVCSLYGLSARERALVYREFGRHDADG